MKVFISYSHIDKEFVNRLTSQLTASGIEVWRDDLEIKIGDNIFAKIEEALVKSDYMIVVLSKSYQMSKWAAQELNAFALNEMANKRSSILPVLIEDCEIPLFLQDRMYLDFRQSFDAPFKELISFLSREPHDVGKSLTDKGTALDNKRSALEYQVRQLHNHFINGELSLFCGAGVSIEAGVPAWSILLADLLSSLFDKRLPRSNIGSQATKELAQIYQNSFNPSPLIVAQYLKNGLGDDFLGYVRTCLYQEDPTTCPLIDAIVELCRPQRSRESIQSIITFNFDDLIEYNLGIHKIKHRSIYSEGQHPHRSEIPIYHAHGYLPRSGDLTPENQIVFSEDAYHSQFIDSFSWSNLIQLNHLSQNVCVFLGVSLTDPNLRRLLDVSMRKNPNRTANHYIFRKRYNRTEIHKYISATARDEERKWNAENFARIIELLEEQDANNLGLNIIWVDNYDEITTILNRLLKEE